MATTGLVVVAAAAVFVPCRTHLLPLVLHCRWPSAVVDIAASTPAPSLKHLAQMEQPPSSMQHRRWVAALAAKTTDLLALAVPVVVLEHIPQAHLLEQEQVAKATAAAPAEQIVVLVAAAEAQAVSAESVPAVAPPQSAVPLAVVFPVPSLEPQCSTQPVVQETLPRQQDQPEHLAELLSEQVAARIRALVAEAAADVTECRTRLLATAAAA